MFGSAIAPFQRTYRRNVRFWTSDHGNALLRRRVVIGRVGTPRSVFMNNPNQNQGGQQGQQGGQQGGGQQGGQQKPGQQQQQPGQGGQQQGGQQQGGQQKPGQQDQKR
jgi:hypothetical protein